jgi:hypothetical protein
MITYTTSVLSSVAQTLAAQGIVYNQQITRAENEQKFPFLPLMLLQGEIPILLRDPKVLIDNAFANALEEKYNLSGWSMAIKKILPKTEAQQPKIILTTSAEELPYLYNDKILSQARIVGVENPSLAEASRTRIVHWTGLSEIADNICSVCLHMDPTRKMKLREYTRVLAPQGLFVAMVNNDQATIDNVYTAMEESGFAVNGRDVIACTEKEVSVYGIKQAAQI